MVKNLENLLNTKVIDRFIQESERYVKLGYNLSELSSKFKLKHDLQKQANDMKRIL
jgi:hypothetical protein